MHLSILESLCDLWLRRTQGLAEISAIKVWKQVISKDRFGVAYSFNVKGTFSRIRLSTSEPTGMDLSFSKQLPYSPLAHHRNTEGRWYQWRVALFGSGDC